MKTRLVLLTAMLVLGCVNASAQERVDRPLITVAGQAEIKAVPDEVVFNLRATTVDKDLVAAQTKNDAVVKRVLALARQYNVPPEHVQTGRISLEERETDEEVTRKPPVFIGYAVSKSIAIILRDVSKAESLLADIFKSGVTRIESVDFRTTQSRKLRDQARAMAIKAAQEKATALAKEIGQNIGKAYSIVETGISDRSYAQNTSNIAGFISTETSSDDDSTIALGQISISARVIVSFELK